jgi:hypothetical protein
METAATNPAPLPATPAPETAVAPEVSVTARSLRAHTLRLCGDSPEAVREQLEQFHGAEVWVKLPSGHPGPDAAIDRSSIRVLGPRPAAAPTDPPAPGFAYITTFHDRRARLYFREADAPDNAVYVLRWANLNGQPGPWSAPVVGNAAA